MLLAGTVSNRVAAEVESDLKKPSPKTRFAPESRMMQERLYERGLRHICRICVIVQHAIGQIINRLLMAPDELLECRFIASGIPIQQLVIGGFRHSRPRRFLPAPLRHENPGKGYTRC